MHLHRVSDTKFDEQGGIMGWRITLIPTTYQIHLQGKLLYTSRKVARDDSLNRQHPYTPPPPVHHATRTLHP